VDNLERRLGELGALWEAPATPDVTAAVLTARIARRRPAARRVLIVFATTLVAMGTVASIAPARNAILDFFGIGGVRIVVESPPPSTSAPGGSLGDPTNLAEARDRAPFPLLRPTLLERPPDRVFVQRPPQDGAYALVWTSAPDVARGQLTLTQFRGRLVAEKSIDPNRTTITHVQVNGVDGLWLEGGPHSIAYLDRDQQFQVETLRRVGDVLVWERAGITYRIEGARSLTTALRIAASLR
jgi:hypothetical protein